MNGGMDYVRILRDLREDADKTQTQIAEVLGTSQTMYARYERGANELPIHHLITLSKYYGVSTDYLLGLSKGTLKRGQGELPVRVFQVSSICRGNLLCFCLDHAALVGIGQVRGKVICCLPGHGAGKLCKPVVAADSLIAGAVPVVLGHSPPVQVASDVNGDGPGLPAAVLMHHIHIVGVVIGTRGLHGASVMSISSP